MASSSSLGLRACLTRVRFPVLAVAVTAVAISLLPGGVGSAAPATHMTIAHVEARVSALDTRAEKITESYDAAKGQLTTLQRSERTTARTLAHDQAVLTRAQKQVAAGAAAAYRTGGLSPALSLVSSGSAQTYIDQSSGLDEMARYQAGELAAADAAQRVVSAAEVVHNAQVAQARKVLSSIGNEKSQIESLISQQQALLSHLKASQRAHLAAVHTAAVQHEVTQRTTYHPPAYNGAATGRASAAISFAYAQLGKPYQWGGAGPGSFDCSGLTMRSWEAGGVSLPHSAAGQQAMLPRVSVSALEPGDLVFYGDPAYHTAIYIGGGRIIQAPHTGANVEISSLAYMPPTSAGRP